MCASYLCSKKTAPRVVPLITRPFDLLIGCLEIKENYWDFLALLTSSRLLRPQKNPESTLPRPLPLPLATVPTLSLLSPPLSSLPPPSPHRNLSPGSHTPLHFLSGFLSPLRTER